MIGKREYNNLTWEPYFHNISPTLAFLYFHSKNYHIRFFLAMMIFKKLSWLEKKAWRENNESY